MEYAEMSDIDKKLIESDLEKHTKLESERSTIESHWQECLDYIVPRKADITTRKTPGDKRGQELFDTTAITSNLLLAGALHGMLTNPATRFFDLVFGDPLFDDDDDVKMWLQESADAMFHVMNNSNFQTEIHEIYLDEGSIGTACLYMGDHEESVVHFSARSMKEIFVDEDNLGRIDTVHRAFHWKPRQIIQEFGEEEVPEFVLKKYKEGCEDPWPILHIVAPEREDKPFFKFASRYLLKDQKCYLSKKGYPEMPYAVPRWTKTSGEKYGRGPGMEMLPDIKMCNVMMETTIKGAQKTVDPPLMVSDDGVIGRVRLTPGGLTVVRQMSGDAPIRPLITDARIDFGYQAVEDVRKRIRAGFYVDQLQLNDGPQMTATEVNQRTEEKLRLMGPVLGRQHFEFLRPVIERVFGIMERRKLIKPAPPQVQGKKFDVRYSSLVARAQRMSDGQNLMRAIQVATPILQAMPETVDNLNGDASIKYIFDVYGVSQKLMNNKRDVQKKRDARDQATQEAASKMDEQHQAEVVQKVGPTVAQMKQASTQQGGAAK